MIIAWIKARFKKILIVLGILGVAAAATITPLNQCQNLNQTAVHSQIANINSAHTRAVVKGLEIAKLKCVAKTERTDYQIEILSIKPIEGGIEVFARAWTADNPVDVYENVFDKNGKFVEKILSRTISANTQIGFGKDGTVDLERFLFYNPPILVPDVNGSIVRIETHVPSGRVIVSKYREDLREALLQDLEHTIKVKKQKFDDSKIIAGKIGSTSSTFHPAAGANDPVDGAPGFIGITSWTNAVNGSGGFSGASFASATISAFIRADSNKQIFRMIALFGTSTIGSDTVDSAIVSLMPSIVVSTNSGSVAVVDGSPASASDIVNSDYENAFTISSPTEYATRIDVADFVVDEYEDFSLTNLAIINTGANSEFGFREGEHDVDDSEPVGGSQNDDLIIRAADTSGTTQDPKLVVEHSSAPVDTCTAPASGDWYVSAADNCYVSSDITIQGTLFLLNDKGPGSFNVIDGAILSVHGIESTSTPIYVEATSGAEITFDNQDL